MHPHSVKHGEGPGEEATGAATEHYWKNKWKTFGQELPVSGLRYATSEKEPTLRRIIWAVLILGGLGFMLYQIIQSFIEYYERPVDVSLSYHISNDLQMPTITICPENRYSRSQIKALGIEYEMEMLYPPYNDGVNWIPYFNATIIEAALNRMNATFGTHEAFIQNISIPRNRTIFQCYWEGQPCDRSKLKNVYTRMGQCFSFNYDGSVYAHRGGSSYGLILLMDVDQDNYIAQQDFSAGVRVMPHPHYEVPDIESRGVRVSPGRVTQVQLERIERTFLKSPYGNCTTTRRLRYFSRYTIFNCQSECITDYIFSKCGCYALVGTGNFQTPICSLLQERVCVVPAYFNYATSSAAKSCDCPASCDELVFTAAVSSSELSAYFVRYLAQNVTQGLYNDDRVRADMVTILAYYPAVSHTKLKETVGYTTTALFNDLGGALGLMLGSTFFTLYEVIDFIIWASWERHRLGRRISEPKPRPITVNGFRPSSEAKLSI